MLQISQSTMPQTIEMEGIAMTSKFFLVGMGSAAVAAIILASVFTASPVSAKPEFAAQTGKPCGACHANPAGGGKLTGAGEKFKAGQK
jgi:hypothetical protein